MLSSYYSFTDQAGRDLGINRAGTSGEARYPSSHHPMVPSFCESRPAYARHKHVMDIVARIAATMATNEASSVEDCQMVAVIPRIVPIAPGPHTHDFHATWRCVAASF